MRPFIESTIKHVIASKDYSIRVAYAVSQCMNVNVLMTKRCPFCYKEFKTKASLASHIYSHEEFEAVVECVRETLRGWQNWRRNIEQ